MHVHAVVRTAVLASAALLVTACGPDRDAAPSPAEHRSGVLSTSPTGTGGT
ncbi:MAG: hypothetical protein HOQ45_05850, partial [Nocardioidaceae bacterium]|nr:hypothetical protein [Nocardioidaceae bacterium]